MSQKYRKRTRRSTRKRTRQPEGQVLGIDEASVQLSLPIAEILAGAHDAVEAVAGQAGLLVMQAIINQEVKDLTGGDRHERSGVTSLGMGEGMAVVCIHSARIPAS